MLSFNSHQRSMSIWSTDHHNRRLCLDTQRTKRNHPQEVTGSEEFDALKPRVAKRRRCTILEQGFADLSLYNEPQFIDILPDQRLTVSDLAVDSDITMGDDDKGDEGYTAPVMLPSHIEEPEQEILEIHMKTSSWYELSPDRK